MVALTVNSYAQVLPPIIDPSGRSGEPPPLQKEKPLEPVPSPLVPPPSPGIEAPPRGPVIRVFVREIRISGNTVFTNEELGLVTAPFLNRELVTEDLEALRRNLTLHYVQAGYITSGAIIPDQAVTDGIITVHIIEGELSRIDIEGTEWFRPGYLRDRIVLSAGPPVNITVLQERLQLLQQDPRLQQFNAELRPGVALGQSELKVKVTESNPLKGWVEFNNFQTPLVGAERGLATVLHQNVTGNGDPFSFTYGRSDGVDPIIDTFYSLPFTKYDTTLSASYRRNDFIIVEEPFDVLNLESDTEIINLTLLQPLYRTLNHQVTLAVVGEYLFNRITLAPFGSPKAPFNLPGFQNGVAQVSALRFIPEWVYRTQNTVLAIRQRFSVGLNVLGATINSGPVPDGQFFSYLGQVQAVRRVDEWGGIQLVGRFDVQLANDRLFPLERIPVGGRFSVRGYRENTLVRDNALLGSLEVRIPVYRSARGEDVLQLAPFLDYGNAWNHKDSAAFPGFLASLGLGLRWNVLPQNRAYFEVYWGTQLNHFNPDQGNLQDHGIHLQAVMQVF